MSEPCAACVECGDPLDDRHLGVVCSLWCLIDLARRHDGEVAEAIRQHRHCCCSERLGGGADRCPVHRPTVGTCACAGTCPWPGLMTWRPKGSTEDYRIHRAAALLVAQQVASAA